ncbi:MAG: tryptophan--tRNA ligase [Elusimicrobia bacterium]|nr:tryptophan--tRNA ligase [Elusimicrobiota bacterium]
MIEAKKTRQIVVSGMRPTGRLQLGNYWGALKNWVELQDRCECYFIVVDWHALTTSYRDSKNLRSHCREMVLDWLAAGLDPEKCVMFVQSQVKEHAELHLLLSMIVPTPWLLRNPTVKEQAREMGLIQDGSDNEVSKIDFGHLGYPVLQAADIMLYRGTHVPVGEDQLPHLELSREIARRFNSIYGETLPEPQALLTPAPKVPGLDGRKMSKSYDNSIELGETAASLEAKIRRMFTDPKKVRQNDKGHPEGCVVYAMHKLYSPFAATREQECRDGAVGCVQCKKDLAGSMEAAIAPFREKRRQWEARPGAVDEILESGRKKAQAAAEKTMAQVRRAMHLTE